MTSVLKTEGDKTSASSNLAPSSMDYNDESIPLRYRITTYLNSTMMGFSEGNLGGLRGLVADNLKRIFGMHVSRENVDVVIDDLPPAKIERPQPDCVYPGRLCWSIHVDHNGVHYESVIVNLGYDTGYES